MVFPVWLRPIEHKKCLTQLFCFSNVLQDDGYEFIIQKVPQRFRGTIGYCSGDNLGSQALGGFKEGSRAHRPCRDCMGNTEEIKINVCTVWFCNLSKILHSLINFFVSVFRSFLFF